MADGLTSRDQAYDVVVLGAGIGGMATALFAALRGLSVLLLEKSDTVGGTTAISAGTGWIPGTMHAAAVNPDDTRATAETYLRAVVGNRLDEARLASFLEAGPAAIALLDRETEVRFRARPHHPDYLSDRPGATLCGRALEPLPFDGRRLGRDVRLVRPPLETLTLGGMMVGADDIRHFLGARRSPRSALHVAKLAARHALDRLRFGRGTRLLMGNALCARLLASLRARNVEIRMRTVATDLVVEDGRVVGVTVEGARIRARRGVVLATGGFTHAPALRERYLPRPLPAYTATPRDISGDGMTLACARGAALSAPEEGGAFWAPVSVRETRDGTAIYPHFFLDRGKPGVIAVDRQGRRFVNEATSYDAFGRAMYAAGAVPCWLLADAEAVRRYGLGLALPGGFRLLQLVREGYIRKASTLSGLARSIGIDEAALAETVRRFNAAAATGRDPDFGRGETAANLVLGDPGHSPNPCLRPLGDGPYYAVELHPGINGTSAGLRTDPDGHVLTEGGEAIPGLFACGNDAASMMAGTYPGPGTTIGPAIAAAYVIAGSL